MPKASFRVQGIGIAVIALSIVSCAYQREMTEKYEWQRAVAYVEEASGPDFLRCFQNMTYLKPTFDYEPWNALPGQYYPHKHHVIYSSEKSLFHESLHAIIYGAPRDCLEHMAIYGAEKSERLKTQVQLSKLR